MPAIKGGMRNVLLVIAVMALWPAPLAAAEQPRAQKSDKSISTVRQHPLKGARTDQILRGVWRGLRQG